MNSKLAQTFSSLQHPNYRLWFTGQVISIVGTWMQATAQGFLVYELTQSASFLGLVGFASGVPSWLFTLFGGVIADRVSRRKLLIIAQSVMMVLAFLLAFLVFTDLVQPWHVVVLAFLLGVANSFDAPARQAFVVELVGRADMTNAIALNSSIFNIGTVIGPAIAGLVYSWLGPGWCFTINGVSYLAVIGALLVMRLAAIPRQPRVRKPVLPELMVGIRFAFGNSNIRILMIVVAAVSVFGMGLMTLIPAWASAVLQGDVRTNGWLLSARGVGSLIGALMIAYLGSRNMRGKIWAVGSLVLPMALIIFAIFRELPVSLIMLVILGWAFMAVVNTTNAMIQSWVPDELRGRVMSVHVWVFMGSLPIGSLLAGELAERLGEPTAVLINGSILLAITLMTVILRPSMKKLQ
jgi:predicted MFS family arabinose efflux permease